MGVEGGVEVVVAKTLAHRVTMALQQTMAEEEERPALGGTTPSTSTRRPTDEGKERDSRTPRYPHMKY